MPIQGSGSDSYNIGFTLLDRQINYGADAANFVSFPLHYIFHGRQSITGIEYVRELIACMCSEVFS